MRSRTEPLAGTDKSSRMSALQRREVDAALERQMPPDHIRARGHRSDCVQSQAPRPPERLLRETSDRSALGESARRYGKGLSGAHLCASSSARNNVDARLRNRGHMTIPRLAFCSFILTACATTAATGTFAAQPPPTSSSATTSPSDTSGDWYERAEVQRRQGDDDRASDDQARWLQQQQADQQQELQQQQQQQDDWNRQQEQDAQQQQQDEWNRDQQQQYQQMLDYTPPASP